MTDESVHRLLELCQEALARPAGAREAFLDRACAGDPELRKAVEALLAEQSAGTAFLATPAWAPDRPRLAAGTRLGPYEIQSFIGAGGMGQVYRASDTRLGRIVAIKVLPPDLAADPDRRRRFEQEARAVAALNHPHICTLHDIGSETFGAGSIEVGTPPVTSEYLVMEFIDGQTLADRLAKGPVPLDQALEYAIQIADALAKAHRQGIIHRDLKPGNVMLTKSGAKLLDFGLAKLRAPVAIAGATSFPTRPSSITLEGAIVGTLAYMSPEQVEGKDADARSDIFSFGTLLYEMLTRKRAFDGDSHASVIAAILERDPAPLSTLEPPTPPALDRVVVDCLRKDPDERWQSAADLKRELARIAQERQPARAGTSGSRHAAVLRTRRHRLIAAAVVIAVVGIAAGIAFVSTRSAGSSPVAAFHRLTFKRGFLMSARFMPDGQTVVYTARWDGHQNQAFSVRVDGTDSLPLAALQRVDRPVAPAIASVSSRSEVAMIVDSVLSTVPFGGGVPRPLRADVSSADWSPDGRRLALTGGRVVEFPLGTVIYRAPNWTLGGVRMSPRGDHLAFRKHRNNQGWIEIVDVRGTLRAESSHYEDLGNPVWSPDNREVWFPASDAGSRHALRAMDISGRERTIARFLAPVRIQDISREGRVLLTTEDVRFSMGGLAPGDTAERDLTWYSWSVPDDLSPDGRTVLFTEGGELDGAEWSQFLRATDGSPALRLGMGAHGRLSPDRQWVVAFQRDERWNDVLALLPSGPGQTRRLTTDGFRFDTTDALLGWLPDSSGFLFTGGQRDAAQRTWLMHLDGSAPVAVTPEGSVGLLLTPDGKRVLARAGSRFWMYPVSGGDAIPLPGLAPGPSAPLGWVPYGFNADGTMLRAAPYPTRSAPLQVVLLDPFTGRVQPWKQLGAQLDPAGLIFDRVHFTDDGRSYVYGYSHTRSVLYVVDGWR